MSKNFDLLNEIEAEYRVTKGMPAIVPRVTMASAPVMQSDPHPELLSMARAVFLGTTAPQVVILCGVDKESGSSLVCNELGRILARCSKQSVCLVDGDIRGHRLSRTLDLEEARYRSTSLHEGCLERAPGLWVAETNVLDPNDDGILAPSSVLKQAIANLRSKFEFVLIDAPGVNVDGDAAALGQLVDAAILVLEANATRKPAALKAKTALEAMNVRLFGTVLNNRTYPIPEPLYRKL